ncbi:hypothetical protein [Nocardia asiatica]|uniref:hypothetical protein n=1 Tax=Nocardia asiatica TaxID=209252 RepID=UPI0002F6BFD9|nr:hypothetical protein [Nocardia asiatica]
MTGRWGRAGVRLSPGEIRERRRRAGKRRLDAAHAEKMGHRMWAAGQLIPYLITLALGDRHGPGVDIACGAAEPAVDRWELGQLYPSWAQTQALAQLTGWSVPSLCRSVTAAGPLCATTAKALAGPPPILRFDPEAVVATLRAEGVLK